MADSWNDQYVTANGIQIHYVRHGAGFPLILIHGWPGFWYEWHKNIMPLAEHFDVIAPDQRGYGDTEKPDVPAVEGYNRHVRAEDLRCLADTLGLGQLAIVAHDTGSWVAQTFVIKHPERVPRLFLFNPPYPGVGDRWVRPDFLKNSWYMWFHQQPWAARLVGSSREAARIYFGHFLSFLSHDSHLFDEELDIWVDNFLKPGNLQGGFNWYIAMDGERRALAAGTQPKQPAINVPTRILWGENDPMAKTEWADRLGEFFSNYTLKWVPDTGHFVQYERPDLFNTEVIQYFASCGRKPGKGGR